MPSLPESVLSWTAPLWTQTPDPNGLVPLVNQFAWLAGAPPKMPPLSRVCRRRRQTRESGGENISIAI